MHKILLLASLSTRVSKRPDLGGIVVILLENPAADFNRDTNNAILNISLTSQRNRFFLNYHNICHKIKKPLTLDIHVNSNLQS